ncbi:MAG TPA: DUF2844 domain-containing protein [Aquella sp.]|nr:DUF2844 domain-containing protein [Aquella sp.]
MNKLLILLLAALLVQISSAISLGDTMNQEIAAQTNTATSVTKLTDVKSKYSTFVTTSATGNTTFLVNNKTNKVYSISWQDNQAADLQAVLGKYYPEFQNAGIKKRIPLRAITVDDGDLTFSQFGSMLSGVQGSTTVRSLAPQE